ncbi:hypothetical protein MNBD_NITROSPINAE01-919 [hydrothermal vent metagenome]|uniref:SH3b domain-containing protein n=1 Tax=hydrothermal vent metagenome TaxID=652676 RepID=A0A3B1CIK0_9ZZZZ
MRLVVAIALLVAITSGAGFADTNAQKYNEANKRFTDGDYLSALELYNSIGIKNQNLEYNRGVAYFKLGRLGKAVLHFNRALRLNPNDEDARANLKYINSIKKDKEKENKTGTLQAVLSALTNSFSMNGLTAITLVFYLLTALAISGYLLVKKTGGARLAIGAIVVCSTATLVFASVTGVRIYKLENKKMAVAMQKEIVARTGPTENANTAFIFHEGTVVTVGETRNGFVKVILSSGITAWAHMRDLEKI